MAEHLTTVMAPLNFTDFGGSLQIILCPPLSSPLPLRPPPFGTPSLPLPSTHLSAPNLSIDISSLRSSLSISSPAAVLPRLTIWCGGSGARA